MRCPIPVPRRADLLARVRLADNSCTFRCTLILACIVNASAAGADLLEVPDASSAACGPPFRELSEHSVDMRPGLRAGGTAGSASSPFSAIVYGALLCSLVILGLCCIRQKKPISSSSPRRSEQSAPPLSMHSTADTRDTTVSATNPMREARPPRASLGASATPTVGGGLGLAAGVTGLSLASAGDPVTESLAFARSSVNPLQRAQQLQQSQQLPGMTPARPPIASRSTPGSGAPRGLSASYSASTAASTVTVRNPAAAAAAPPATKSVRTVTVVSTRPRGGTAASNSDGDVTEEDAEPPATTPPPTTTVLAAAETPESDGLVPARVGAIESAVAAQKQPAVSAAAPVAHPPLTASRSRGSHRRGREAALRARPTSAGSDCLSDGVAPAPVPLFYHRRRSPPPSAASGSPPLATNAHCIALVAPGEAGSSPTPEREGDAAIFQPEQSLAQPPLTDVVGAANDGLADTEAVAGALGRIPAKPRPPPRRVARAAASSL